LKDRSITINNVSDHGISIGIYFSDPDGNGIEVSYELPRSEWPRKEQIFAREILTFGRFPGPWDADAARRAS
jgi:catechol 2,3-dioxygenase